MPILRSIPLWTVVALLVYMPFHIFLSQSLSLVTGGLEVWKIAKDVVLGLVTLFTICLVWHQRRATKVFTWMVGFGLAYCGLHVLLWAAHADLYQTSAALGTIYNVRLPCLAVLAYGAVLVYPHKFSFSSVFKLVLVVSSIVALLGVVQFFLPKDLLTHVGYSLDRGARPAFFIDDKEHLPRIMSTLREPNALGAYLIVPLTALSVLVLRAGSQRARLSLLALWLLHGVALLLTFSRSAWLGAALAVGLVVWWRYSSVLVRYMRRWWPMVVALLVLVALVGFWQRDNPLVQSYLTHSTAETIEDIDSNQYHWLLVRQGAEGVIDQPLGHGPGTAGIVSIQNPAGAFLTENYYIQIAYEVGLLGLALFIAFSVLLYMQLRRRGDYLAAILLASFWGYVVTNMLLHTWSNEAVAAQWWLLAGLALFRAKTDML